MPALIIRNLGDTDICLQLISDRAWKEICDIPVNEKDPDWQTKWHLEINNVLGDNGMDTALAQLRRKERVIKEVYCQGYVPEMTKMSSEVRLKGVLYLASV